MDGFQRIQFGFPSATGKDTTMSNEMKDLILKQKLTFADLALNLLRDLSLSGDEICGTLSAYLILCGKEIRRLQVQEKEQAELN